MKFSALRTVSAVATLFTLAAASLAATHSDDGSLRREDEQLPRAMHSRMKERPVIRVGVSDADILGTDNRALQAAVDYVAGLGGGTVEIGPGEFIMRDSLHLRSFVTKRATASNSSDANLKA